MSLGWHAVPDMQASASWGGQTLNPACADCLQERKFAELQQQWQRQKASSPEPKQQQQPPAQSPALPPSSAEALAERRYVDTRMGFKHA